MTEFWEENFIEKGEMWGAVPARSATIAKDFFMENKVKTVLIPGIGYGRNARIFVDHGMKVTGIEISKTAIEMAYKHLGSSIQIHHGSVTKMPFDNEKYDAVYCHALIHLLDTNERGKLIQDCYNQLNEHGYLIFTMITTKAPNFGKGIFISENRYEFHKGAKIYYYDKKSVQNEFGEFGIFERIEVVENQPMFLIKCQKKAN